MLRNYLAVGFRALMHSRIYAFINIFGLATGLAACLLLLLYVRYERSYDAWLPNAENIYQLQTNYVPGPNGPGLQTQMSAYVSGASIKQNFPEVARRVFLRASAPTVVRGGEAFNVENARMVEGPFFDMFRIPLLHGNARTALNGVGNVVLARSQALRIFGTENPVGRTITLINDEGAPEDHRVTGVFADLPRNSHLRVSMLVAFTSASLGETEFLTSFGWQNGWNYLELRPGVAAERIHAGMPAWERRAIPDQGADSARFNFGDQQDYRLVNVRDVHLGRAQDGDMSPGNDARTLATFSIVALIILAMACVNFTNLATARASRRAREVALRKVLGASRKQLIAQFLGESTILAIVSMLAALALVELALPSLSAFLDADLAISYFGADGVLLPVLGLILLVGAVGGFYPAIYLSRFRPAEVLKANNSGAEPIGSGRLRNILVVAQFAASIALIICTSVVYAQTLFARQADPGFDRAGLIQISNLDADQLASQREALVEEVRRIPGVTAAVRTGIGINTPNTITNDIYPPGRGSEGVEVSSYAVGADFFRTLGVDTVAGRTFDPARPGDDATIDPDRREDSIRGIIARGVNVVINERAARMIGYSDPRQAVGRQLRASVYNSSDYGLTPITIIGVVQDSRFRTVRSAIEPIMFRQSRGALGWMVVRYENADPVAVRDAIQRIWRRVAADVPFKAEYSEEIVAEIYEAESARAQTFAAFALLAVIIAAMGLFGLAAFTAERRTREIGIRKVFGAGTTDIVNLLAWQFSKPVIIANVIAWPVAWWVMRDWLNTFDARIDLGPTPFLLAGLLALAIAVGTIAGHAIRVARTNPIHALRYE